MIIYLIILFIILFALLRFQNKLKDVTRQLGAYEADNEMLRRANLERKREKTPVRKEIVIMPPKLVSVDKSHEERAKWISFLSNFFKKETDTIRKIIPSDQFVKQVDTNSLSSIPSELHTPVKSYLQLLPEDISPNEVVRGVNKFLKNNSDMELFKTFQRVKESLEKSAHEDAQREMELQQSVRKDTARKVLGGWQSKNKSFIAANKHNMQKLYTNFCENSREKMSFERFMQLLSLN
jgi:hypothetical protein